MTVLATSGNDVGATRLSNEVLNVAAQSMTLIKGLTGFDLSAALTKGKGSLGNGASPQIPSSTLSVDADSSKLIEQAPVKKG